MKIILNIYLFQITKAVKTKFYIVIVLILSVSFAQAQSNDNTNPESETNIVLTSNEINPAPAVSNDLISPAELKESIARTNSDIRVYYNRVRVKRVENIKLLFPKIHKAEKA
ncbi:hypothetical protein V8G61_05340 [Gaetbulibacter sp. M240]|uniref:hypothetical protein n=1 Tax=Gaetbulibacter sp. M240 TaxID=3126511 RepID=UPI00374E3D40